MSDPIVHTYSGSPLNRLAWLRSSQTFLNRIIRHSNTRWIVFKAGQPLTISSSTSEEISLFLTTDDVKAFLGPGPYFGQGQHPGELIWEDDEGSGEHTNSHSPTKGARHLHGRIVFLGLHELEKDSTLALSSADLKDPDIAFQKLKGTPYFALDVAELSLSQEEIQQTIESAPSVVGKTARWTEPRSIIPKLPDPFTSAVFASARSMVDWNFRNKFCPGCGSPTYSMWGGWKIACTSLLPWANNNGKPPCPSGKGLQNYTHPRTDAVVIMIAIDETGDKILLGRGRRFPGKFYSSLAGFIEPGESFEDAVKREMWEEAGLEVWNVRYHSAQPWPYPANLMVGFYARADSKKPIRIDLDNELVDARWFTREEVLAVLNHRLGTTISRADHKLMDNILEGKKENLGKKEGAKDADEEDVPPFVLPPQAAIAGVLIREWAEGRIGFLDQRPHL